MDILRELSRWSHIIAGFGGLLAFWFPVFARKGGRLHRVAGKVFVFCGYWVTASAGLSCVLVTAMIYSRGLAEKNAHALDSLIFLFYLAWSTFVALRYAVGVLGTKKDPTRLATPMFSFLAWSTIVSSGLLLAYGLWTPTSWSTLFIVLSPIGLGTGLPMLKYMRGGYSSPKAWFYEHMSATVGAGIAFHTAFAVFGASRLFTLPSSGLLAILPWVLPAAVGTPALALWKRHYQRKFGELPRRGSANADTLVGQGAVPVAERAGLGPSA